MVLSSSGAAGSGAASTTGAGVGAGAAAFLVETFLGASVLALVVVVVFAYLSSLKAFYLI